MTLSIKSKKAYLLSAIAFASLGLFLSLGNIRVLEESFPNGWREYQCSYDKVVNQRYNAATDYLRLHPNPDNETPSDPVMEKADGMMWSIIFYDFLLTLLKFGPQYAVGGALVGMILLWIFRRIWHASCEAQKLSVARSDTKV